VVKQYIHIYNH